MIRARLMRRLPRSYFSDAPVVAPVTIPARNEDRAGPGVEVAGAGLSSAPAFPAIFRALAGSHRQATTDHPAACGLLSAGELTQLRAARLLNL